MYNHTRRPHLDTDIQAMYSHTRSHLDTAIQAMNNHTRQSHLDTAIQAMYSHTRRQHLDTDIQAMYSHTRSHLDTDIYAMTSHTRRSHLDTAIQAMNSHTRRSHLDTTIQAMNNHTRRSHLDTAIQAMNNHIIIHYACFAFVTDAIVFFWSEVSVSFSRIDNSVMIFSSTVWTLSAAYAAIVRLPLYTVGSICCHLLTGSLHCRQHMLPSSRWLATLSAAYAVID